MSTQSRKPPTDSNKLLKVERKLNKFSNEKLLGDFEPSEVWEVERLLMAFIREELEKEGMKFTLPLKIPKKEAAKFYWRTKGSRRLILRRMMNYLTREGLVDFEEIIEPKRKRVSMFDEYFQKKIGDLSRLSRYFLLERPLPCDKEDAFLSAAFSLIVEGGLTFPGAYNSLYEAAFLPEKGAIKVEHPKNPAAYYPAPEALAFLMRALHLCGCEPPFPKEKMEKKFASFLRKLSREYRERKAEPMKPFKIRELIKTAAARNIYEMGYPPFLAGALSMRLTGAKDIDLIGGREGGRRKGPVGLLTVGQILFKKKLKGWLDKMESREVKRRGDSDDFFYLTEVGSFEELLVPYANYLYWEKKLRKKESILRAIDYLLLFSRALKGKPECLREEDWVEAARWTIGFFEESSTKRTVLWLISLFLYYLQQRTDLKVPAYLARRKGFRIEAPSGKGVIITADEFLKIYPMLSSGIELPALFILFYFTGMRGAELERLELGDVQVWSEERSATVHVSKSPASEGQVSFAFIPEGYFWVVKRLYDVKRERERGKGNRGWYEAPFFHNYEELKEKIREVASKVKGCPVSVRDFRHSFASTFLVNAACIISGIEEVPENLRPFVHSYYTRKDKERIGRFLVPDSLFFGADIEVEIVEILAAVLGHASAETTFRYYLHTCRLLQCLYNLKRPVLKVTRGRAAEIALVSLPILREHLEDKGKVGFEEIVSVLLKRRRKPPLSFGESMKGKKGEPEEEETRVECERETRANPVPKEAFSARTAARYLGISKDYVHTLIEKGILQAVRWGNTLFIRRDEVERLKMGIPKVVAERLGVSVQTVYTYLREGKLQGARLEGRKKGRVFISPESVLKFEQEKGFKDNLIKK